MILLIDNYDSFTYNLYQYMGIFREDIEVVRNDKITIEEIRRMAPEKIVLSPGPKSPKEAGICLDVVKEFYDKIPILGICLGHQTIGEALGGTVTYAKTAVSRKTVTDPSHWNRYFRWNRITDPGSEISFSSRISRRFTGLSGSAGHHWRWRDYGNAAQGISGHWITVSSGIGIH